MIHRYSSRTLGAILVIQIFILIVLTTAIAMERVGISNSPSNSIKVLDE
jgi:hypothetical protein